MSERKVSVIIPSYKRAPFLVECVESILGQTLPPSQILLVNDGSCDATRSVIAQYGDRIEYLETPNAGKAAALNKGLTRVTGEYVWIFDDDDVALPDAVERHVKALEENPQFGFSYSTFYFSRMDERGGSLEPGFEFELPAVDEENFVLQLMESNFLCGAGIFVRAQCYRTVGPFDEELVRSQDYEMAIRIARRFRGVRIDGPAFHYRQHSGLRGSSTDRFSAERNQEKWREYDRKFFQKLRLELDLREYLPRDGSPVNQGQLDTRRAYLQRMTVMASKGLYEEMLQDLGLALAEGRDSRPLSEPERGIASRALAYSPIGDRVFVEASLLRRIRARCHGSRVGQEILLELSRRLYWHSCDAWQHRSHQHAFRSLVACVRLAGWSGVVRGLAYKLKSAFALSDAGITPR